MEESDTKHQLKKKLSFWTLVPISSLWHFFSEITRAK